MKKTDLIRVLATDANVTHKQAAAVLESLGNAVSAVLRSGDEVTLPGIGKMVVTKRPARTARNPQTGESMQVPAKNVAKLRVSSELANSLN